MFQDNLIKLLVPMTFFLIWAITSVFNRDAKPGSTPTPNRPPGPNPNNGFGPRPTDPPLRWGPPPGTSIASTTPINRRVTLGDDDILIIQPDPSRGGRPARTVQPAPRRGSKAAKAQAAPPKKPEPAPVRTRLAGVSQNVNQQLSQSLTLVPLSNLPTEALVATATPTLRTTASAASIASAFADPARLREAFLLNELLGPPVSLRNNHGRPR